MYHLPLTCSCFRTETLNLLTIYAQVQKFYDLATSLHQAAMPRQGHLVIFPPRHRTYLWSPTPITVAVRWRLLLRG